MARLQIDTACLGAAVRLPGEALARARDAGAVAAIDTAVATVRRIAREVGARAATLHLALWAGAAYAGDALLAREARLIALPAVRLVAREIDAGRRAGHQTG